MSYNDFEGFFENEEEYGVDLNSQQLRAEISWLEDELERKREILTLTLELENLQKIRAMKILEGE
jgi:hypothetical protein